MLWCIGIIAVLAWLVLCIWIAALLPAPDSAAGAQVQQDVQRPRPVICRQISAAGHNKRIRKLNRITDGDRRLVRQPVCWWKHRNAGLRIRSLCKPRHLVTGRVSVFSDGITASGKNAATTEGLAVNLRPGTDAGYNNSTTQGWMKRPPLLLVKLLGRQRYTTAIDIGPAGWVNRALDFSAPLARAMGFSVGAFPTDSIGRLYVIRRGCR